MAEKRFENKEMQKRYDSSRMPEAKGGGDDEEMDAKGGEDGGEDSAEDVVAEHGPADSMEMTSHHADGHKHKAHHHSPEEAHEHLDKMMPMGESEHEDAGGGMGEAEMPGGMPTMAK
jgi:hypothetical protein